MTYDGKKTVTNAGMINNSMFRQEEVICVLPFRADEKQFRLEQI